MSIAGKEDLEDIETGDLKEVPQLPRVKFFRFAAPELLRIGLLATVLVALIVLRKPCADGIAKLISSFDVPVEEPESPDESGILRFSGDESEEELRKKLEEYDSKVNQSKKTNDKVKVIRLRGDESPEELRRLGVSP